MPPVIFHQGDLNSGISRAIQEQKLVACFVRGDDEESDKWETEWFANTSFNENGRSLGETVGDKAVLLRIEFGSKEASFLNVFCPVTKAPTLAIIHNGTVVERIESGTEYDEFLAAISKTFGLGSDEDDDQGGNGDDEETVTAERQESASHTEPPMSAGSQDATQTAPVEPVSSNPQLQQILSERGARLEVERKKQETAEKERIKEANARRKAAEHAAEETPAIKRDKGKQRATSEQSEQQSAREAWIYQQKKRKDEAKHERERILAQIEADKRDRKVRAEQAREAHAAGAGGALSELPSNSKKPAPSKAGNNCSIQVRLFDGSSIRARFAADADIATAVRTWVKETSPGGGADQPFTFRQILAPEPSRPIEVSEEHYTLRELGLLPDATLVLVPVAQYATAYSDAGGGYIGSALQVAYDLANSGYNLLGSIFPYVPPFRNQHQPRSQNSSSHPGGGLYMGGAGDEQEPSSNAEASRMAGSDSESTGSARIRVKTLADQRSEAAKKQGAEFYNGNSLRFEGQDEGDSDKK